VSAADCSFAITAERGFADELRQHGLKSTRQRLAVLQILHSSPHHLSAVEVHERVRALQPGVGLATIYRTLERLADLGLSVRVHLDDGCHRYALAGVGHRHQLICSSCGLVLEFGECSLANVAQRLASETNFSIDSHWLQFFGRCRECQIANIAIGGRSPAAPAAHCAT